MKLGLKRVTPAFLLDGKAVVAVVFCELMKISSNAKVTQRPRDSHTHVFKGSSAAAMVI